ncbi:vacuolar sorting-associated 8 -like protein [Brachionus plicatilis]|uniref:Vacuolar sorting-associated 8-like protein n=1 Tax=Brachionus plicatilis TaxID=10195 RepID=A0A3M7QML6_BRAPC|nr:vacuolar sorting-associated 8 -like protein [Brachionus plicatilis]
MIEYLCNREELNRVEEREQTLIGLLNGVSIQLLERFDLDRLLDLCKRAKFYRASEILYKFKSEYCEIIDCYLNDDVPEERHAKVFELIREILKILFEQIESSQRQSFSRRSTISEPRDVQLKKLNDKLSQPEVIERMLRTNAAETVHLLWIELNLDLKSLVMSIKNHGQVLFNFLTSLLDLLEYIKTDRKYLNYISQFSGEYCELYVDLMCQFDPHNLINILKSSLNEYSFRIDECIRICREHKHVDGLAYLLEKSGQIESAFNLHLEKINSLIKDLQKNVQLYSELELDTIKQNIDALLVMIVKLCQTHSCSLQDGVKQKIWFSLFDEVMRPIQSLFLDQQVTEGRQHGVSTIDETRDFFKNLGSYIINSMVGYVNLTIIIDRMICDPLYGASNFGDIKPLMLKMMEICAYEQILLDKTNDLVSHDVYCKMAAFTSVTSKSFSSLSNYCQSCSKQLDSDTDSQQVHIFHCGHSFHQMCLDLTDACSICHSTSNGVKISRSKKKERVYAESRVDFFMDDNSNSPTPSTSKAIGEEKAECVSDGHFLNLGDEQINALRSLRSRNASIFKIKTTNGVVEVGTNLERNSQLALAPANLINFI